MTEATETTETQERPLVTFTLFAYNQEQFIREAVEGAFSQTYSPMEIILSDDCSADRTFEIIQEMSKYYVGPHAIVLNRHERNLGIGGHVNRIMELAQGELVVAAAGDDISFNKRVEVLVDYYLKNNKPDSLFSDYEEINEFGPIAYESSYAERKVQSIVDFIISPSILGASHAWRKDLFNCYGKLESYVTNEDRVIPFRSYSRNGVFYIKEKLIYYRVQYKKFDYVEMRNLFWNINTYKQYLCDIEKNKIHNEYKCFIQKKLNEAELKYELCTKKPAMIFLNFFKYCIGLSVIPVIRILIRRVLFFLRSRRSRYCGDKI